MYFCSSFGWWRQIEETMFNIIVQQSFIPLNTKLDYVHTRKSHLQNNRWKMCFQSYFSENCAAILKKWKHLPICWDFLKSFVLIFEMFWNLKFLQASAKKHVEKKLTSAFYCDLSTRKSKPNLSTFSKECSDMLDQLSNNQLKRVSLPTLFLLVPLFSLRYPKFSHY